jgi:hypothetical protein
MGKSKSKLIDRSKHTIIETALINNAGKADVKGENFYQFFI